MIVSIILLFFLDSPAQVQGKEKLPRRLLDELSGMMFTLGPSSSLAVDQYTVAVIITPEGLVDSIYFSVGTPEGVKSAIRLRVSIATINFVPLAEYWKKISKDYGIQTRTCIIQPVFVRFSSGGSKKVTYDQEAEKFSRALTFEDSSFLFQNGISFIWLNARNHLARKEQIIQ